MYLSNLKINGFRSIENLELNFQPGVNAIGGKNGIGKTTIIDSILWILTDETLVCGIDNGKNLNENDKKMPLIVEGTFVKDDGTTLVLKRDYRAIFKDDVFHKYQNELYINGIKYSVTEYFKRLNEEIGLINDPQVKGYNTLRSLIDINYFSSIDYKIARKKLEQILKIEDDDDIVNHEEFKIIRQELIAGNYDVSKVKSYLNKQKDIIENSIEKNKEQIEILKQNSENYDEKKLEDLKQSYETLKGKEYQHSVDYLSANEKSKEIARNVAIAYNEYKAVEKELSVLEIQNQNILKPLDTKTNAYKELQNEFVAIKSSIKECPNCHYKLNEDDVKKQLLAVRDRARVIKKDIETLQASIKTDVIEKKRKELEDKRKEHQKLLDEQQEFLNSMNEKMAKENEESKFYYSQKTEKLSQLLNEIKTIESQNCTSIINKLVDEQNTNKNNLSQIELKLEMLKDFEKEKINSIKEKVNFVFPNIEFILTDYSNTGAEIKTCKATYKNVDYERLNDAKKILIGIELTQNLAKALGLKESLPIIFDKFRDLDKENILYITKLTNSQVFTTYATTKEIEILNY